MTRATVLALLALLPLALALDCRKFSFAPACRGIMLKRSEGAVTESDDFNQLAQNFEVVGWLIREAEADGIKDCLPLSWLKAKLRLPVMPKRSFSSFA